jgi:hypothetical protein
MAHTHFWNIVSYSLSNRIIRNDFRVTYHPDGIGLLAVHCNVSYSLVRVMVPSVLVCVPLEAMHQNCAICLHILAGLVLVCCFFLEVWGCVAVHGA